MPRSPGAFRPNGRIAGRGSLMHIAKMGSELLIQRITALKPNISLFTRHRPKLKLNNYVNFYIHLLHPARYFLRLC
jgi:hypothetical protein